MAGSLCVPERAFCERPIPTISIKGGDFEPHERGDVCGHQLRRERSYGARQASVGKYKLLVWRGPCVYLKELFVSDPYQRFRSKAVISNRTSVEMFADTSYVGNEAMV